MSQWRCFPHRLPALWRSSRKSYGLQTWTHDLPSRRGNGHTDMPYRSMETYHTICQFVLSRFVALNSIYVRNSFRIDRNDLRETLKILTCLTNLSQRKLFLKCRHVPKFGSGLPSWIAGSLTDLTGFATDKLQALLTSAIKTIANCQLSKTTFNQKCFFIC